MDDEDLKNFKKEIITIINKHDLSVPGAIILLLELCEEGLKSGSPVTKRIEAAKKLLTQQVKKTQQVDWRGTF